MAADYAFSASHVNPSADMRFRPGAPTIRAMETFHLQQNLRWLQARTGLGQVELAKIGRVAQSSVSRIVGRNAQPISDPGYQAVARWARHFGVSMDDLTMADLAAGETLSHSTSQPTRIDPGILLETEKLVDFAKAAGVRKDEAGWAAVMAEWYSVVAEAGGRAGAAVVDAFTKSMGIELVTTGGRGGSREAGGRGR